MNSGIECRNLASLVRELERQLKPEIDKIRMIPANHQQFEYYLQEYEGYLKIALQIPELPNRDALSKKLDLPDRSPFTRPLLSELGILAKALEICAENIESELKNLKETINRLTDENQGLKAEVKRLKGDRIP